MAITDSGSVLVLGAGVSAPFGLSLGGDMISEVAKSIRNEISSLDKMSFTRSCSVGHVLSSAVNSNSEFRKFPIHCTMTRPLFLTSGPYAAEKAVEAERKKLSELERLLDDQTSETIDDFIVENPSHASLTKICIASLFIQSCYNFGIGEATVKPFSSRRFPPSSDIANRNWVHLLINIIRQGIRSKSVSPDNKVKIITFNYDKILEHVLKKQFSNTEASYNHYTNFIEIIHVHGECGDLEDKLSHDAAEICRQWANGIHVINEEAVPDEVLQNRELAKEAIRNANELFFCGFSFAGPNCRLLGLDSLRRNGNRTLISFCNYDGNIGISKTVAKIKGRVIVEESAGSKDSCLGVSDWIKQGQLGELPG